ncbi:MAG TPA: DinB family protein [Acidimicrobiales bacterium]|jgi:uncharacterized damage-inducible protein DinB|nr:DinB family protein [Acidimicrobiales bacterium]
MPPEVARSEPAFVADEGPMLDGWLDYHRATLLQKCEGLTDDQMVQAAVAPSALTLLGLLRHMTLVEWWWFEHVFAAGPTPEPYANEADPDADFNDLVPESAEQARVEFVRQCEHSRALVAAAPSLNVLTQSPDRTTRQLRWVMVHMIEEYARHNGHADLLRERIDGAVGE